MNTTKKNDPKSKEPSLNIAPTEGKNIFFAFSA